MRPTFVINVEFCHVLASSQQGLHLMHFEVTVLENITIGKLILLLHWNLQERRKLEKKIHTF